MKVLLAGSSSGGHIFPALALAEELTKEKNIEIFFLQTRNEDIDKQIAGKGFGLIEFNLKDVSFSNFKKAFLSIFKLFFAFFRSLGILLKLKPDIVLGFGGYHSGPIVLVAHFLRIPTLIHEQNVLAGKANRILAKFVDKIAVTFQESTIYFKSKKTVFTGCPVRKEITDISLEEARKKYNVKDDKFTIFIMGGSQGSHNINLKSLNAISAIIDKERLRVIHITGYQDYSLVLKEYSKMNIDALVFAFLKEIGYAYKLADIAITRAGASTISELIALRLPAIIIPYPFAGGHQMMNASILHQVGAAILVEDKNLSSALLKDEISLLLSDKNRIKQMQEAFNNLKVSCAVENLAKEVLSLRKC